MKKIYCLSLIIFLINLNASSQQQADSAFYSAKESQWLKTKTGFWNVVMTMQATIDSKPIIIKDIEAERSMVGAFCLHEIMQPTAGASMPKFKRLSDLDYNYNDTRWDYMSIDTRITGGIMFFTNFGLTGDSIVSYMLNFPHPGLGPKQTDRGKMVRVRNVVLTIDANHDVIKQYWKLTDGKEWLAIVYDYTRRKD